jgi:hypothetical protein
LRLTLFTMAAGGCSSETARPHVPSEGGQPALVASAAAGEPTSPGSSGAAGERGADSEQLREGPGEVGAEFASSPDFVTRMSGLQVGLTSSPHQLVQIYYSANIEPVLATDSFGALPQGTVALKLQSRDGDDVVDQVMLMIKQAPGTDPDHGDWIWEQRRPTTLELVSSSETSTSFRNFCSGCHAGFTTTDWLAGTSLAD